MKGKMMQKEQPEALRLAAQLEDTESAMLHDELKECQEQRRAAFRRIEELDRELDEMRVQIEQGVPDGWQLVPKEPTPEMCAIDFDCDDSIGIDSARICYKAMLASAPPAPQAEPDYKALYEKAAQQYNELAELIERKQASVVQQEPSQAASDAYDRIDHFLRQKLDDHDYAHYSFDLDLVWGAATAPQKKPMTEYERAVMYAALSCVELQEKDPATMFKMIVEGVERFHNIGEKK